MTTITTSPSYTHSSQHQAAAASWPQSVAWPGRGCVAGTTAQHSSTRTRPAPAPQQTPPHSHSSAGLQSSALVTRRAILSYKYFAYRLLRMKYNVNKDLLGCFRTQKPSMHPIIQRVDKI